MNSAKPPPTTRVRAPASEGEHGAGLAPDKVAEFAVDVFGAERVLQADHELPGPEADVAGIGGGAVDEQAELGDE